VAIRFHLETITSAQIACGYSPMLEASSACTRYSVLEPKHHPLQHPWARRTRALPVRLRDDLRRFAFLYDGYAPNFFAPTPARPFPTFDSEVERIANLSEADLIPEFEHSQRYVDLRRHPNGSTRSARSTSDAEERRRLAAEAVAHPQRILQQFLGLLSEYWRLAFRAEWTRLEPQLADALADTRCTIARTGLAEFLRGFGSEIRVDHEAGTFTLVRTHEHDVRLGSSEQLLLCPSVYSWPHVFVNCEPPYPLFLVYPAPAVQRAATSPIPPDELLRVFRVLGDDTRMRALQFIAARPRSTEELAPLVGVSEAALSKHLRVLTDAGIVAPSRDGYYVLYELVRGPLERLTPEVLEFLGIASPSGK
jgi:DNA-binding transcriptional ArsR family regulator